MAITSKIDSDLSLLIENEKRELARGYLLEMWEELREEGLEPELLATEFVESTLKRLAAECGGPEATRLISRVTQLDEMGLLPETRSIQ